MRRCCEGLSRRENFGLRVVGSRIKIIMRKATSSCGKEKTLMYRD